MAFFKNLLTGFKEANSVARTKEKEEQQIKFGSVEKEVYKFEQLQYTKDQKRAEELKAMSTGTRPRKDFVTSYRVIAIIVNPVTKEKVGYRVITENTLLVKDMTLQQFYHVMDKGTLINGRVRNYYEEKTHFKKRTALPENTPPNFVPLDGTNIKKFPVLRADNLSCIKNDLIIVRARVTDDTTKDLIGFLIMDYRGHSKVVEPEKLMEYKKMGFLNVKMTVKNGKPIFQAIKGKIPNAKLSTVQQNNHGLEVLESFWV